MLERNHGGSLPPVVLLHGLSSAGVHYWQVLRHLDGAARVILPDLPGHGFSDTPATMSAENLLAGLTEALDAVLDQPAVLTGNSLGGYAAIRYALARPEKVAGLLLAAPAGAAMDAEQLQTLRARFTLKSHSEALRFADALFALPKRSRHLYALGLRRYFALPQTRAVVSAMQPAILFTPAELARLTMPILMLWGEAERILPESSLEFFRAHLPAHARIQRPKRWGHSGFLDDPRGFAEHVLRFADEVATGRAASAPRQ